MFLLKGAVSIKWCLFFFSHFAAYDENEQVLEMRKQQVRTHIHFICSQTLHLSGLMSPSFALLIILKRHTSDLLLVCFTQF